MAIVKQPVVEPSVVLPSLNFAPFSGPVGTAVTLSGTALSTPVTLVLFNGVPASRFPDPNNPNNLVAIVPQGATDGPITVTHPDGSSTTSLGTFDVTPGLANPMIRSFFPTSGAPGTQVQLDGSGFTQADTVLFGGIAASQFLVQGDVNIIAVVPADAQDGPITVKRGAQSGSSTTSFDVTQAGLSIAGFSPSTGVSGTVVTLTGSGFLGVDTVLFGNLTALFTVLGDGQINATAPAGLAGQSVNIVVKKGLAQAVSNATFTYSALVGPSISTFAPVAGPVGTSVTISGSNLSNVSTVRFGGAPASFTILSGSTIVATVPAAAVDGFVTVEALGQFAQSSNIFDVTTPFSVTSLSPASGTAGMSVTIDGSGLTGVSSVAFGSALASFSVQSDNRLVATVPLGNAGTTVAVQVRKNGLTASGNLFFTYAQTGFGITGFSPVSGPVGTQVTIFGNGFVGTTAVKFGGQAASFQVVSASEIRATVPATAIDGFISVEKSGAVAQSAQVFDVTTVSPSVLQITSLVPNPVSAGQIVRILGSGFSSVIQLRVGRVSQPFTIISDSEIRFTGNVSGSVILLSGTASAVAPQPLVVA